jgi:hypothetical protein
MGRNQAGFTRRTGLAGTFAFVFLGAVSQGCATTIDEVARTRAAYDLQCNDVVRVEPRFGGDTYMVARGGDALE